MRHTTGDVFTVAHSLARISPTALGHGVNARGAAGGIAAIVFNYYPEASTAYLNAIRPTRQDDNPRMLGKVQLVRSQGLTIANMWTQTEPGPNAKEWAVMSCLHKTLRQWPGNLVIPLIGGGIGGLDPDKLVHDFTKFFDDRLVLVTQ
jgi:hypothetical protein